MSRRVLLTLAFVFALGTVAIAQPDASQPIITDAGVVTAPDDAGSAAASGATDPGSGSGAVVHGSAGSGSAGSASSSTKVDAKDPESLAKAAYRAVTTKNWFLLAGVVLSIVALGVNYALKKQWSVFGKDRIAWTVTGALAGVGALANAWLADAPLVTEQTFMGAVKVFAAAVFAYVSTKKLFGKDPTTTAPASP